jgi:hypothetical protein
LGAKTAFNLGSPETPREAKDKKIITATKL